jgi:hypothetical protein
MSCHVMLPTGVSNVSSNCSSTALTTSSHHPQQQQPTAGPRRIVRQQVPDDILHDPALAAAMSVLPANYNFEIHKTVWRVRQAGAKQVGPAAAAAAGPSVLPACLIRRQTLHCHH